MGFVLLLRGVTCLHGCAVAIDGRAIAILGPAGAGKSTLAAAFARLGYPVLSEDIVALDAAGSEFIVRPGYPGIRLWPASVKALYGATDSLPLISPNWDKRYLDLRENSRLFQSQPLPLAAVYVLGPRQNDLGSPTIESLSSQDRLMALLENSYSACLMDKAMRRSEFDLLGRVANQVPSRWVNPSENIADLSRLCSVLLADFRSLGSSVLSA